MYILLFYPFASYCTHKIRTVTKSLFIYSEASIIVGLKNFSSASEIDGGMFDFLTC